MARIRDSGYFVYIMASRTRTFYTGMANDPVRRTYEHRNKLVPGFTSKYNITRLVYYEVVGDARLAIAREKEIKGWRRGKKAALVERENTEWKDLSETWL